MAFDPTTVGTYSPQDVPWWFADDDDGSYVGYLADRNENVSMGLAFVHFRAGVRFDFAWPYDEVSIVTKGSLRVRSGGSELTAEVGEFMNMPVGVPGTFEIEEDLEMACVHHPTYEVATGMSPQAYKELLDAGQDAPIPEPQPRGPELAGGFFDPTIMQTFAAGDVPSWTVVDEEQGARVGYVVDQPELSPMGLAFSHFSAGGIFEFAWPYDEVGVVTKGSFTVRTDDRTSTGRPGDLLYMPQGVTATFEIDEDIEVVGVHSPTSELAQRRARAG